MKRAIPFLLAAALTGCGPVEIWALQSSHRLIGAKVRAFLAVVEKAFPDKRFVAPL